MAKRMCFISLDNVNVYDEKIISFTYYSGFALIQKQKSIQSLHENIIRELPNLNVLEISSKSFDSLGRELSAFNLKYNYNGQKISVENIFQASKSFELGGPYVDLLYKTPIEAKKDSRLTSSGELKKFIFNDIVYPLLPRTLFYDWIYCNALKMNPSLVAQIKNYNVFTDIEFNHEKSINCQARSVAIFVGLLKNGLLEKALSNIENFKKIVYKDKPIQLTLFD